MTDRDLKPDNVFSSSTYRTSPASVIAHAVETGVVRDDGSVRVVISIPKAENNELGALLPPGTLDREGQGQHVDDVDRRLVLCPHGAPDSCRDCERERPGRVIPEDNSRRRGRRRRR